jgi:hypothetical protein
MDGVKSSGFKSLRFIFSLGKLINNQIIIYLY